MSYGMLWTLISGAVMNVGAPGKWLNVMSAVTGEPAVAATGDHAQRSSVEPSPLSKEPLKYSSGPGSTIGLGTAKAPIESWST